MTIKSLPNMLIAKPMSLLSMGYSAITTTKMNPHDLHENNVLWTRSELRSTQISRSLKQAIGNRDGYVDGRSPSLQ